MLLTRLITRPRQTSDILSQKRKDNLRGLTAVSSRNNLLRWLVCRDVVWIMIKITPERAPLAFQCRVKIDMRISCGAGRRSKGDGRQISLARLAWPLAPIDNTSAFGLNVTHASSPSPLFLLENLPSNLAIGTPCFDLLKNEITEFTLSPMDEISWIMCDRPRVFFRDPNLLDRLTGNFFFLS